MFGSNNGKESKDKNKKSPLAGNAKSSNLLVRGTTVEGDISTETDIRLDGKMTGKLSSKGKVIIGPSGEMNGDIECQNAVIEGHFNGNLLVHELLMVKETAHVEGDVRTNKLVVQSGSVFNVSCGMGKALSRKGKRESVELEELGQVVQKSA